MKKKTKYTDEPMDTGRIVKDFLPRPKDLVFRKERVVTLRLDDSTKEPRTIKPTHPGEMLREDFLPDYGLTTAGLAEALGVSRQTINEVLREKRAISPVMALRLAQLFGNTPEFWLNAQRAYDLWQAKRDHQAQIEKIKPLRPA